MHLLNIAGCRSHLHRWTRAVLVWSCYLSIIHAAISQEYVFTDLTKASLVFREQIDAKASRERGGYPRSILVYLRLENQHDSELTWLCNIVSGVEAELVDPLGKPVPEPGSTGSMLSQHYIYRLPYGSRMEWLLSKTGGRSMAGDRDSTYALIIGRKGWLIPRDSLASYSLKLRVLGGAFASSDNPQHYKSVVLFDPPAASIRFEK